MRLITWTIQACRGCDGVVSPRRVVEDARTAASEHQPLLVEPGAA